MGSAWFLCRTFRFFTFDLSFSHFPTFQKKTIGPRKNFFKKKFHGSYIFLSFSNVSSFVCWLQIYRKKVTPNMVRDTTAIVTNNSFSRRTHARICIGRDVQTVRVYFSKYWMIFWLLLIAIRTIEEGRFVTSDSLDQI